MMHHYPTAIELASMGATLERDVCLWGVALKREYTTNAYAAPNIPLTLTNADRITPRVFASQYVGVSVWKERWYIANWTHNGKPKRGRLRPRTPEGERWSAQDRARALHRSYLERRDGTRTPYVLPEPEEMDDAA